MRTYLSRSLWSHILIVLGSIGMVVGAIDPMEGSLVILPGSLLVALGTFLGQCERHLIAYRVWVFILVAIGVGAMWGLSMVGGFGGKSGLSMWWGVLILPYLIGWSMGIWGPGSPRWLLLLGTGVGLWYLFFRQLRWFWRSVWGVLTEPCQLSQPSPSPSSVC
jgi:hypothetical protein